MAVEVMEVDGGGGGVWLREEDPVRRSALLCRAGVWLREGGPVRRSVLLLRAGVAGRAALVDGERLVGGANLVDRAGGINNGAARGSVPSIMAAAEEEADRWLERERTPKRIGEVSQAAFLMKAQSLGFGLALPWGDSEKYDFVVWARPGGQLLRVQVKATERLDRGGYDVQPVYSTRGEGKKTYTARDIDVLAAHVQGKDVWYLLPIAAFEGVKTLRLFPDLKSRNPRWEEYREAWEWLRGGKKRRR